MSEDTLSDQETDVYVKPGDPGHNTGKEVVWTRWQKKRTFVRALEGTYGEVYKSLYSQPRVYPHGDFAWKGGPGYYDKAPINPQAVEIAQSIECHISAFAAHCHGQKHGHMNSAVFYILTGTGHDVHDGVTLPYASGDACIVENGCVHQHFNDGDEEMIALVMKAKPLFLFMHMLFQKVVEYPPKELPAGVADYDPPTDL
jgi:mannose-6-phosphate isomerase-like protein (cupin superfamily)